jgi:predicted NAD/FAD-binding protein
MKIAVIGAGIAGIAAAWRLQRDHEVTLFEANSRLGGHTDTHSIVHDGATLTVDSGFIVFNERNYPLFTRLLAELGVLTQPSDMSFSVRTPQGVEYGTSGLAALFCRRANLLSIPFWRMLRDLRRFYRELPRTRDHDATLGEWLAERGYSDAFTHLHIAPMCGALWSQSGDMALEIPVSHVLAFMDHHQMLQIAGRPRWRVVSGGSRRYVDAFEARFRGVIRQSTPVRAVLRHGGHVDVVSDAATQAFEHCVLACHSDQALTLLGDASTAEREVLGAIRFQTNKAVVHSDPREMPAARAAWSSWNAIADEGSACRVTYWMNRLQGLEGPDVFVTLNPRVTPARVWLERTYAHPVFDLPAVAAQGQVARIDGVNRTWFCGAYWGWGFHEDGMRSAERVARAIGGEIRRAA